MQLPESGGIGGLEVNNLIFSAADAIKRQRRPPYFPLPRAKGKGLKPRRMSCFAISDGV